MKLVVQTLAYEDFEETVQRALRFLIDDIEIVGGALRKDYNKVSKEILEYKETYDLEFATHLSPQWFFGSIDPLFRKHFELALKEFLEFTEKIGAEVCTVHCFHPLNGLYSKDTQEKIIEVLKQEVQKFLEEDFDVILSLEVFPQYSRKLARKAIPPSVLGEIVKEFREQGYKNVGLTFDPEHINSHFYSPIIFAEKFGDYVTMVHLSDNDGKSLHQHLPPGKGNLPLKDCLEILKEKGYDYLVSLEMSTREEMLEFFVGGEKIIKLD